MAQRLYSVGLINEVRWSKSSGTESCSSPICVQRIQYDSSGLEKLTKQQRHSSIPSIPTRYSPIPRSNQTSAATLSVHIQSMKKSAFKMLCKLISILLVSPKVSITSLTLIFRIQGLILFDVC
jgi:hypothetical protein